MMLTRIRTGLKIHDLALQTPLIGGVLEVGPLTIGTNISWAQVGNLVRYFEYPAGPTTANN